MKEEIQQVLSDYYKKVPIYLLHKMIPLLSFDNMQDRTVHAE